MINRNKLTRKLVLVWLSACVVTASGCRLSPVLEQVVYEQNHTTDQDQQSKDDQPDNQEVDQDLASKKQVDDAESQQDTQRQDAVSGEGNAQSDTVYGGSYQNGAQTYGVDNTSPENQTEAGGGAGMGDGSGTGSSGSETGGTDNGTGYEPGTTGNKMIVDARGMTIQLPDNVASVTAPGELGLMVEMLGGSNRLLASSDSLLSNSLAQQAFSTQGISGVNNWWGGTGTGAISDTDFQTLLNSKPDVCLEISGSNSFTSAQVAQLQNAGIVYAVLPKLNSVENIKSAVTLMGTILGNQTSGGGTDAPTLAKKYCDWVDNLMSTVAVNDSNRQKYSLFISDWDASASWSIENSTNGPDRNGTGAPIAANKETVAAFNDCLKNAMVSNTLDSTRDQYVNPLRNGFWLQNIAGNLANYDPVDCYTRDATASYYLGDNAFPAIVVANENIKTNLQNDIHWNNYGQVTFNKVTDYGFMDSRNTAIIQTTIHADYEIYVNPAGIGNWVTGSVETPLEAAWVSAKLQGQCSLDQVRTYVKDFYQTFYNLDVDTKKILNE